MKSVCSGLLVAFSMYSAIPVPQVEWTKRTMRWALLFLPLVGAGIGAAEWGWYRFCVHFGAVPLLYAAVAALLPLVLSGGIHLDGLVDTCDALCSFGDREKRLAILKDPHVGAFGPLWLAAFLIAQVGVFAQLYETPGLLPAACCGFALARAFGGRKIVDMPCAKDSGLAHLFAAESDKTAVAVGLALEAAALTALMGWCGGLLGLLPAVAALVWNLLHRRLGRRVFGGITGDLAGFYISTCELLVLAVCAMGGLVQ